jgi:hypothetical protein
MNVTMTTPWHAISPEDAYGLMLRRRIEKLEAIRPSTANLTDRSERLSKIKSVIEQSFRMLSRRSHGTSTKYPEMAARTLTAWVATPSRRTWIITEV